MSGKLDQSLDDILGGRRKQTARRGNSGRSRRAAPSTRPATRTSAGGIQKNGRRTGTASAASVPVPASGDSKVIVSNLPSDVTEAQIKEYFGKTIAPIRRVMLTYGPSGASRGVATIIFSKPNGASQALAKMNGMLVDQKPMKVEVVLDAKTANPPKALGERLTTQSKGAKPRSATGKPTTAGSSRPENSSTRGGRGRGGRRGRVGRPKKTADELDAEMADYFEPGSAPANNENAAQNGANGEDFGMGEIS